MIRLAGALLAAGGMAWMGWSAARRLARRERILVQLSAALAQMEREISFRLTPMPQLLGELAEGA
ncbi:stage III sporulation protein AB, partial [Pseudoflavonifractor phocaeensis]|nr:stage III sporulation protein AB [Pseudoflavonifractor phocaeensis]